MNSLPWDLSKCTEKKVFHQFFTKKSLISVQKPFNGPKKKMFKEKSFASVFLVDYSKYILLLAVIIVTLIHTIQDDSIQIKYQYKRFYRYLFVRCVCSHCSNAIELVGFRSVLNAILFSILYFLFMYFTFHFLVIITAKL